MQETLYAARTTVVSLHESFLHICVEVLRLNSGYVQLTLHVMPVEEYTGSSGLSQNGAEQDGLHIRL